MCLGYKAGEWGLIPGSERPPGEGNGNPLQYACHENSMDRGAWLVIVYRVAKSRTRLHDQAHIPCTCQLKAAAAAKSCPTLSDPMDCSLPGSSIHGILQARVLEWGAIAFSSFKLFSNNNNKKQQRTVPKTGMKVKLFLQNLLSPLSDLYHWNTSNTWVEITQPVICFDIITVISLLKNG